MKFTLIPQDTIVKQSFFTGLFIIIIALGAIGLFWTKLPPEIPLFFSKPRGEAQLAPTFMLFIPLILSLSLLIVNAFFSQLIASFTLLKQMIILGAVAGCILSAITVIRILFLVTY